VAAESTSLSLLSLISLPALSLLSLIFLRSSDLLLQISPNLLSRSTSLRPPTSGQDAGAVKA